MPPSRVWTYFSRSSDKSHATCNLCNQKFVYKGTTSNLLNHINGQHPTSVKDDTPTKQQSMQSFFGTPKKSKTDGEKITQAIADMVVSDYVPLSIVEGQGFKHLLELVAPGYTVPSRNTIRARIQKRYNTEKETLTSQLKNVTAASITTDTWTSNTTQSFITVTEHHVDDNWDLNSNVLITRAMPERHTGENLAVRIQDCVKEFKLESKVETCVHDNARNIVCAGNMCEEWGDLGCFAHTLQLSLKTALEIQEVANVTSKCRKLVGHFKHSTTLTAEFTERQKADTMKDIPKRSLVQDVSTRWNSTYEMMARLVEQRRIVSDIMLDPKFTKKADSALNLSPEDWELIAELCVILEPFKNTTEYMCTEKNVSVSEIYPIVCGLINKRLTHSDDDSVTASDVKDAIRTDLIKRYQPAKDTAATSTPALGSLLDPRHKKLHFFSASQRRKTQAMLESRLDDLPLRLQPSQPDADSETPAKRRKLDFVDFGSPDNSTEDELQLYMCEKMVPDCDPLTWWRKNEGRFPKVAVIAKKVLSVPATSVPSERVFSCTGLLLNKLRNSLSSDIVDSIVFLNKNKVQVKITDTTSV